MQVLLRIILLSILVSFIFKEGFSQDGEEALRAVEIFEKFGQVSETDFEIEPDHSYPYEFLLKESTVRVEETSRGIIAMIDYLVRIKVLSDDPFDKAEASMVGIPFYFADGIEQVRHIEGITHQPDGSRSYLSPGQLRTVDLNTRYRIVEFEMPDVQQGSILEYKYRIERRYIEELPDFHFAQRVPTREAVLNVKNSEFVRYNAIEENVDFDVEYIEQFVDTSSVPLVFTYQRPEPVYIQKWRAEDIPAVEDASYISSIGDIRAKIRFQISEFGIPRQPLENSWEFVKAQILRNNNPYDYIEAFTYLKEIGEEIAAGKNDAVSVQDSVFQFVNENVQYNGQTAVFAQRGLAHVLNGEPANQAEINMTLLAILRGAGIDAKPFYLSGREFGRINKEFPSLYQFNSMLVISELGGDYYFMDASFPHSLPNLISVEAYNVEGMLLTDDNYEWIDISPDLSVFSLDISLDARLTPEGDLRGTISAVTGGYASQQIRRDFSLGTPSDEIIWETFFDVYPDAVLQENQIEIDEENRDKIYVNTQFEIPNYAVTFTEGVEFRPMVVGYLFSNPFEADDRNVPITLDAPEFISINYKIDLPDGYSFETSGETNSTSLSGAMLFEEYLADGNTIEYSFDIEISRKEFSADEYTRLRRLYERWVTLSNDIWFIEIN